MKCGQHHSMSWGPGLNRKEEVSQALALVAVSFRSVDVM